MSVFESFRDSLTGTNTTTTTSRGLLPPPGGVIDGDGINGRAAAATAQQQPQDGHDFVFSRVLALYAQQQRHQKECRETAAVDTAVATASWSKAAPASCTTPGWSTTATTACNAAVVVIDGDGGNGDGGEEHEDDGGFSAKGVATAAAAASAAVCDDWEGDAETVVKELRDARNLYPSEVCAVCTTGGVVWRNTV